MPPLELLDPPLELLDITQNMVRVRTTLSSKPYFQIPPSTIDALSTDSAHLTPQLLLSGVLTASMVHTSEVETMILSRTNVGLRTISKEN